jgi:hypothetical protein
VDHDVISVREISSNVFVPSEEQTTAIPEFGLRSRPLLLKQQYDFHQYVFGFWDPVEPYLGIGEGFFLQRAPERFIRTWARDFWVPREP